MARTESAAYDTWSDFKAGWSARLFPAPPPERNRFLFRGQRDASWDLATAFDRRFDRYEATERVAIWDKLVSAFVEMLADSEEAKEIDGDLEHILAAAQHYGLPTRLLDWTTSPYQAAYFAFEDAVTHPDPDRSHVAVWALDSHANVWKSSLGARIVRVTAAKNPRMRAQSGRFTLMNTPHQSLNEYVESFPGTEPILTRFVLPAAEAVPAIQDLDLMGITAAHLFPGLEGICRTVLMDALLGK